MKDGWTDEQREAVQEFCKAACHSLMLTEGRGDVLDAVNRMLQLADLVYSSPLDEELLEELTLTNTKGLWA